MDALSTELGEITRKSETVCINAISKVGQDVIAQALNTSEPTVSRIKNEEMPRVLKMLAAAGVKAVLVDRICVKREEWALMTKIVARAMSNEQMAANLLFEDVE